MQTDTQILHEILGRRMSDILNYSNDVQKFLWEQLLVLCLYSRQIYLEPNTASSFHNRMLMLNILLTKIPEGIKRHTLIQKLNEGASSTEIINCGDMQNTTLGTLNEIESLNIAFPKDSKQHPYTYSQMFQSLKNPIDLFQKLLEININEELLFTYARNFFNGEITKKKIITPKDRSKILPDVKTLAELFNDDKNKMIQMSGNLYEAINEELLNYVEQKCNPLRAASSYNEENFKSLFEKNVTINNDGKDIDIKISKNYIKSMSNIGQFDAVTNAIKAQLSTEINLSSNEPKEHFTHENKLISISKWQKLNSMSLIKKLEQCPRLIASILKFDLQHQLGSFCIDMDRNLNSYLRIKNPKKTTEIMTEITNIIRFFLYYNYSPNDGIFDQSSDATPPVHAYQWKSIDQLNPASKFQNELMIDWQEENQSMRERFKKLPQHLIGNDVKSALNMTKLIEKQIQDSKKNSTYPFPVDSKIPMPLWVKITQKEHGHPSTAPATSHTASPTA